MAGYNTFCEILSLDKRAILVPRMQAAPRAVDARAARRRRSGSCACSTPRTSRDAGGDGERAARARRRSRLPSRARRRQRCSTGSTVITDLVAAHARRETLPEARGRGLARRAAPRAIPREPWPRGDPHRAARRHRPMPAVMIYVQHLLGIGHLMRARVIAEALAGARLRRPSRQRRHADRRAHAAQRPHVVQLAADPRVRRELHAAARRRRSRRSTTPIATRGASCCSPPTRRAAPAAVLFETFPFGRRALRFELLPAARAHRRDAPAAAGRCRRCAKSCSCRRSPSASARCCDWAARWFDAVLVHGDPRFARFEETYPLAVQLDAAGALHRLRARRPDRGAADGEAARATKSSCRPAAGRSASTCSRAALAAQRLSRFGHLHVARARRAQHRRRRLSRGCWRAAGADADRRARARRFPGVAAAAHSFRSRRAATTPCSTSSRAARGRSSCRSRAAARPSSAARGVRLARFGLAVVVDDRTLTPGVARGRGRRRRGTRDRGEAGDFDSDGAAGTGAASSRAARPRAGASRWRRDRAWQRLDAELEQWRAAGRTADAVAARRRRLPRPPRSQRLVALSRAAPGCRSRSPSSRHGSSRASSAGARATATGVTRRPARLRAPQSRAAGRAHCELGGRRPVRRDARRAASRAATASSALSASASSRCWCRPGTGSTSGVDRAPAGGGIRGAVDVRAARRRRRGRRGPRAVQHARRPDRMASRPRVHRCRSGVDALVDAPARAPAGGVDAGRAHRRADPPPRARRRGVAVSRRPR